MSKVDVDFLDRGFHRVVFDSMPMPVFVVDEDISILEYNSAAARLVGQDRPRVLGRFGGEALHCVHASNTEGCGRATVCENCVIRESVEAAFRGQHINRQWARLDVLAGTKSCKVNLCVSCHPFKYERHHFALLILEGL